MRRLTVHVKNAKQYKDKGKMKTFNTLAFEIESDDHANRLLSEIATSGQTVTKSYISNIK